MKREIKLSKYEVVARACKVEKKEFPVTKRGVNEIDVLIITAVDIRNSKSLEMATGDFGMAVYNELGHGFMISWDIFEILQKELEITEEKYEEFLDDFMNDFSDTVIDFVSSFEK
jgi:hypothetical protein